MIYNIVFFLTFFLFYETTLAQNSNCKVVKSHKNFNLLPHDAECQPLVSTPRVMGGQAVTLGEFPWIAALFLNLSNIEVEILWCTGSIINSKYVLTAAHCMPEDITQLYEMLVRVGEHDLRTKIDCIDKECAPKPVSYHVDKYIPHPKYDINTNHNDIGLIRIKGQMNWNDFVHPSCLPITCPLMKKNFNGENLILSGFGALLDSPTPMETSVLQKVTLRGVPGDSCSKSYHQELAGTQLCVGGSEGGDLNKDACHGDSGGPLMYHSRPDEDSTHRLYLVGLVSSGENCTVFRTRQAPGVYTRVASYIDWILDSIHR